MKYTVTVTKPTTTEQYEAWNYYDMVKIRFSALRELHNLGYTVDVLACTPDKLKGINAQGWEATIVTKEE